MTFVHVYTTIKLRITLVMHVMTVAIRSYVVGFAVQYCIIAIPLC